MRKRELRIKIFIGSTVEIVEKKLSNFLKQQKICPGNFIEHKLYRLGGVYQLVFIYAELINI
jgi:hypothetical protein